MGRPPRILSQLHLPTEHLLAAHGGHIQLNFGLLRKIPHYGSGVMVQNIAAVIANSDDKSDIHLPGVRCLLCPSSSALEVGPAAPAMCWEMGLERGPPAL